MNLLVLCVLRRAACFNFLSLIEDLASTLDQRHSSTELATIIRNFIWRLLDLFVYFTSLLAAVHLAVSFLSS